MTTATIERARGVRFARVLRAETLKATSVAAPIVTAAMTVVVAALFAGSIALGVNLAPTEGVSSREVVLEEFGSRPSLVALPIIFMSGQLLVTLLGTLLVSGERGTGLLRATLAAVPRRTPVLLAKVLLSAAAGLGLGVVNLLVYLLLLQPSFAGLGLGDALWSAAGLQVAAGGVLSLSLLAALATAVGSLFKNTATAAGAVLGFLIVAPVVLPIIPVVGNAITSILPTSAASAMAQPGEYVGWTTPVTGAILLAAWTAAALVVATAAWKRRDA